MGQLYISRREFDSRLDMGVFPFYKSNLKIIEISPSNLCMVPDDSGAFSDWFRIFNSRAHFKLYPIKIAVSAIE